MNSGLMDEMLSKTEEKQIVVIKILMDFACRILIFCRNKNNLQTIKDKI